VLIGGVLFLTVVGIPIGIAIFIAISLWILYRIVRGWLALVERKAMPVPQ